MKSRSVQWKDFDLSGWPRIDDAIASYPVFARLRAWTAEGAWERFAGPVTRLTRLILDEVLVGYHLCYRTFPEWPMYEARDLGLLVRMANFAAANSGRTVDWVHLAGPRYLRSEDRSFFRPLADPTSGWRCTAGSGASRAGTR